MCFSSDPPPTPVYNYESFKRGTDKEKTLPANDEEARKLREGGNVATPTVGDGLGRTGSGGSSNTIRVGATERRNRTGGTILGG